MRKANLSTTGCSGYMISVMNMINLHENSRSPSLLTGEGHGEQLTLQLFFGVLR